MVPRAGAKEVTRAWVHAYGGMRSRGKACRKLSAGGMAGVACFLGNVPRASRGRRVGVFALAVGEGWWVRCSTKLAGVMGSRVPRTFRGLGVVSSYGGGGRSSARRIYQPMDRSWAEIQFSRLELTPWSMNPCRDADLEKGKGGSHHGVTLQETSHKQGKGVKGQYLTAICRPSKPNSTSSMYPFCRDSNCTYK